MADIKKFTGFIAPDGSTHKTATDAVAYTRDLKIKDALNAAAQSMMLPSQDDHGNPCVYPENIAKFLYENMVAIQQAFNQNVVLRDRAKPKKAKKVAVGSPGPVLINENIGPLAA